jgi:ferredoxin
MVSKSSIRVIVDESRCVGSGMCLFTEPAVFDQDEETGIVIVLDENSSADLLTTLQRAVEGCPGQAIRLEGPAGATDGDSS